MSVITIDYLFKHAGGETKNFNISLEEETGCLIEETPNTALPKWTELEFNKCKNCPLNADKVLYCPVAKNMFQIVEETKDSISYEKCDIMVKTQERSYFIKQDLQTGLFSVLGLVMASSACPHFDFLKPMARFHLPFSSLEETHFRILGSYLLEQLFKKEAGLDHDFATESITFNYDKLIIVNQGLLQRVRAISSKDATANAFTILNIFAQMFTSEFKPDFSNLKSLYKL